MENTRVFVGLGSCGIAAGAQDIYDYMESELMGGPAGGCIPERLFDTPIDYDSINETGAIMGSGGMVDVTRYFLSFTQNESCGKCTFCRIGTKRMLEILTRITDGNGEMEDPDKLAEHITKTSLCGLGQLAPNPVLTTIKYFREEYETHIKDHKWN